MTQRLTEWLLESRIPTIRWRTLRDLLGRAESDPDARAAHQAIMTEGPVPTILAAQHESGAWVGENNYYTPKYTSGHWSMMLLAELDADGNDSRLQRGMDFILDAPRLHWMNREFGISCFWGNLLRYAELTGHAANPRLRGVIDYLIHDLHTESCRCSINSGLPCAWGAVRALWGLAALPPDARTPEVETAIQSGVDFLVGSSYELVKANYPVSNKISSRWFDLNFPLFYQADILFVLRVLGELGALDHPGVQPALDWLEAKRGADGRWHGKSPYRSRTYAKMGGAEEAHRWVSLHAATVLKRAGRLN
jgi:hypothetical protein